MARKDVSASNVKQYSKPPKLIHGIDIGDTNELSMSNMGRDFTGLMLTPNKLFAIWDNAANGDPSDQVALFNSILDRDGYIASLVATRIKSVKNKKWSVIGSNEAKREHIEKVLKGAKDVYASASGEENEGDNLWNAGGNLIGFSFDKMLSYLMLKPFFGYSGVKVDFGAGGEYINTFMPVAPENWRFTTNWGVYIQPTAGTPIYINGNKRFEYVMHMGSSDGRYGIPPTTGLCRPISYMYFRKSYAEMHQSRLLEKFGIPWVVSKLAPTDFNNPETRLNIEKQLKNLAGDGAAVVTKDSEIKLEGLGAASNSGVFLEAIKEIKESLAIAILGQQASVQQTGGFSNGQIQENVRNDITASDCKEIEDTVTGLINTIEMNTWGTTECSFKIDYEGLADVEKLGKISDLANKSGLEVDSDYMRKAFSVPVNKKKETATSNTIENILGGGNAQGGSMGLPTSETVNPTESATSSATPAEIAPTPEINNESVNQNPEAALAGLGTAALNDTVKKTKLMAFADISKDVVVNDYITSMVNYSNIDDTLKRRLLYNMPMDTAKAIGYLNDRLSNAILSESGNSDEINKLRFAVMAINPDSVYASVSKEIPVNKPIENKPSNESVAMADEKPEAYGGSVPDFTSTPSNTAVDGGRDLAAEMISGTSAEHMPVGQAIPKETVPVEQPIVYAPDNRTIEEKRAEYRKIATRINEVYKRVDKLDELARASISVMEMGVGGNFPSGIQMPERKKVTAEEAERIAYNENQQKLNDAISQLALQHYMKENLDVDIDILVEDFMSGIPSAFQRLPLIKNTSWNIYNQMIESLKENSSIIDNAKYAVEKNKGNMPSWANQILTSAQYSVLNTALNYWYNKSLKNKESGELLRAIKNTAKQATASLLNTTESAINTFLPKLVSADGWLNLEHTTNAYVANNVDKVMTLQEADRYKKLNSDEKIAILKSISAKLLELKNRDSNTYNEKEKSIISDLNKWYDNSERTRVLSRNYALQNNFIKGRNGLEQNYFDVIRTATDMITAMSIGAGLGAVSKLKYASGLGNFATFGALSNYDIYSEMYANGKSRDESALIAATVSPIIGLLDKLETTIAFGKGAGVIEKETLRKLMKDVSGLWTKTLLNKAKTIGINIASETGIETLQGFVQEMARYLASDEAFKNNNDEQIVKAIMDMAVKYGQDIPADELKTLVDNLRIAYNKDKLNYRGNVNFMEVLSNTFEQGLSAAMVMPSIVILGHKVSGNGRTMKNIEKNTRQTMAQIREDAQNKKSDLLNTKNELSKQLESNIAEKNKSSIENNIFKIDQEIESLDRINNYAKNLQNKFQSGMSAFEADTLLKNYMNFETKGDAGVAIRNALADTLGIDNKNMTIDELATLTDIAEDVILLDNNSLTEQDGKRMFKVGDQLYDENWAGSYDTGDGKIYLNANTAKTPESLNTFFKGVVRHEMTHKGLAGIKNKTATALFRDVWSNMNDVEKYNIAKDYVQHYQPTSINEDSSVNMDRVNNENNKALQDLLAEEYLGKQSENYSGFIKTPVGKRAYYKIKEIWRMIAPKASFSDNEIAKILVEARKNIPTVIIEQRYKQAVKDEAKLLESIKESPDKIPTDLVDIERIDELGYTNNPEDAGWITPDGKMINLNRSDANMENRLDHRTITKSGESSLGMMQFMNAGYIRYSPENNAFEIAKKPTPQQLLTIKRILSSTTKNTRISIDEMKNKIGKDGVYEFTETVTDYDNSYNADELISNIEHAYASKKIEDKYESPLLPFLKPSISNKNIPIAQMKDSDYEAQYKINTLNDKKINALKDVETAVQPNSDIAIKDSIADEWLTMSPEEKNNTVESIYDKAIDEVYSNSTLAFAENDFDKAFTSLIKYMDRNIPSPLYVEKVYRSHDKTTIILEVKSKINPDYNSYIRISGTDESGNGEYINELDSSIKSDFDSVYSNVIDVDKIMDFVNKEAKQELSESKMVDIIEKDANIGMTINTIKKMLGQDVVTDKTLQLLKDIAENKTEKESIINPNANRVRMPAMTLVQFLDGLNTAIKEGESRRDFNYNNNLIAQQNVYDFIDEHIMFDRVREKIKKDINKVSLLENTPEQYFAKVNAIINGYNNIVDISKDIEKNIESAINYILELYPNVNDYPIVRALNAKLSKILSTSNDKSLRSGKELKEISNLIAVAEQYNTVNHAQENRTNITAQSNLVEGYAEGKNDWRRFIGSKVNYLIELLRQNRNNKAIRNKIITTIRSIANITTPEGADKTLATFDDEINTIINSENLRNSANNIIKTVKEMKRLGTRANEFYNLFTNIRASMPKALSIGAVLNKEAPAIINAIDVADIKAKLNNRMNELIKSNPEEYAELSEILVKFNDITANVDGNINVTNLTSDELESLNKALVSLGTMASTDFKDFKNQLKKEYAAMEHLILAQVATAAIRKSKTTLPRKWSGIGNGIKNAFVRKDIIKNVGESFLKYLRDDVSNNLLNVSKHNTKVNEEIAKLDENDVDDIPKIEALRSELITETAITQEDLNLLNSIFGKGYSKSLSVSSVDEIGGLAKVLDYKADTLLNADEEFLNKTGQSVKLLATMFDNIYSTMKSDRVNFMNAINKIIGSKKPSPMVMNTMSKAVDKPFTTWTDSDFEALGTVVARYSINNGIASQQYIDENPVNIGILNMFSNEVWEKQRNQISRNLLALLNNITGFRKLKDWAGLDSSVIANVISLEEDGKIMKTFYSNFQTGEDESIKITDTFSDGFYESLPQNIRAMFSAKDVERMSQYLTSNGLIGKYRNIFARLTPKNQESFANKMREKLSKLATVKQQKVKLLTNQGVKSGVNIESADERENETVSAYFTEAEAMHVYAMMYADMFNKPQYHFIKDSNDGIVINRGGGKMFGDANDLQNLTSKDLGVPLNTTNANIIVNQMLSPEQKRYVELLVERYNKVISPRFKEEYSKATGKAMPEYGMYLPALRYIREPKNKDAGKSSLGSFDIGGVGLDQDGRLKDKVENANAPLIIKDFFALMAETVQFSANYIAFRKPLQDLDNVVSNPLINIALDGIPGYGKGMRDRLKQFEDRITGKTLNHPNEYRWLERMMQNVIATNLFIRPRSILSQLASVPMALRYGNISAGDWGYGDAKAIGKSIVRAVNMSQNGFLPWVKGEEYMLDELKHYSGSVYRRIISGYINGVIDNNPQNYHLINALTGHKDEVNRLLALQFYFDRASMSEIAFNSIKYQMEKNKISYNEALRIAKYKSLYNSHDDRIERIAIEEKYLSEYKKQLSELNQEDVNYTKEKADLGEYIISSQKDIADLKNKQAEFNKLYNEYSTPEMQNKLDKYDIAMQDAATRIKKQFETQSMTSILYSPPINEAGVLRVILPLAYRNSWNRRLISVRNLLNVARNRILRGESEATKEYGNILQKELSNMLISGLYMAIVDMIVQSYWYDDKSEEWKKEFLGKAFAGNANIENNIYKFITQWIYESTQASSSMLPFFNELLESGFLSLVGGDTYNPIKGIFGGKPEKMVRALNLLFTEGRYDKSTKQAIAFLIESLSGIPASRILGIVEGSTVGGEQLIEEYREYKNAWKKYDSDKLIKENSNGLYSYDKDYEKFMLDIKERMIKEDDKEGALEIEDEINAKKIRFDKINKSKKTIPFADANAIRIANNLIDQKNAISKLTNAYEITKRQIEPYIKDEPVIIPNKGSVFFVNGSVSDRLDSDLVLQGLIKIAKVSPDIAKALLKKWSTPRNMSQYVKISNKDYITTGAR